MQRPPRDPNEPLFSLGFIAGSLAQGAVVLALRRRPVRHRTARGLPEEDARALAFAALVATNLGLVLVNRSLGASLFAAFRRPNAALWWVAGTTAVILAGIVSSRRHASCSILGRCTPTILPSCCSAASHPGPARADKENISPVTGPSFSSRNTGQLVNRSSNLRLLRRLHGR